jgi:predicted dehydrogenase
MKKLSRREFNRKSTNSVLSLGAGLTILGDPRSARGTPANAKVIVAVVGCGPRGAVLARGFASLRDCQIAYLCDVDRNMTEKHAPRIAECQAGRTPRSEQDFRNMLEDGSVDAVVVATPTHWHALATIWACQAGKDVYVEKPLCHNAWEGQQMVRAARKYDRVVQVGTQNRSAVYNQEARKYLTAGKLGKVHFVRVLNQKFWANFPIKPDEPTPSGFDWDMWNGPAPEHGYNPTLRHHWHHLWRYCIGDLGNDAAHQFDQARMIVGFELPRQVYCSGGRFNTQGAAETPDTQIATFTYENDLVVTVELTLYTPYMLKIDGVVRDSDMFPYWPQTATRVDIFGDRGVMRLGRMGGGWQVFDRTKDRQPVVMDQMHGRFPDAPHQQNFLDCVRSRKRPNADIATGHRSHLTLHYATMSYRAGGKALNIDPTTEHVDDSAAMQYFRRDEMRAPWVIDEQV